MNHVIKIKEQDPKFFFLLKKKHKIWDNTCNNGDVFVFVPLNKQINSVPESLGIKKQGCYILEHNPCQIRFKCYNQITPKNTHYPEANSGSPIQIAA